MALSTGLAVTGSVEAGARFVYIKPLREFLVAIPSGRLRLVATWRPALLARLIERSGRSCNFL